jgi:hypothetical protein
MHPLWIQYDGDVSRALASLLRSNSGPHNTRTQSIYMTAKLGKQNWMAETLNLQKTTIKGP